MALGSQCSRATLLLLVVAMVAGASSSADAANTVLKFETILGDLHIRMLDNDAPKMVANFLNYVNQGDYNDSFFHRLVPGFVLQGGGFNLTGDPATGGLVRKGPQVDNEFGRSNVRGTLAMAKMAHPDDGGPPDGGPDSATNQFFFNLSDNNAGNLDNQNGGFTVFAYVIGDGMEVVDLLSAGLGNPYGVSDYNLQGYWPDPGADIYWDSALGAIPIISYQGGLYFEMINSVSVVGVAGDVDFDGDVDIDDYNGFAASFGEVGIGLAADFDGDYDVDLDDFAILRGNYGASAPSPPLAPGAATPEPGSICLLGLCGIAMIRKRRGKS